MLRVEPSNSVSDERAIGYLALGLFTARDLHRADDTQALEVVRMPFRAAFEAAMAGDLSDMLTVAMLLKAHHIAGRDCCRRSSCGR